MGELVHRVPEITLTKLSLELIGTEETGNALVEVDQYVSVDPEIESSDVKVVIVPGFMQETTDDPLPFIANVAAQVVGSSFVLSRPKSFEVDFWARPEGQHMAMVQAMGELVSIGKTQELKIIGHSLGGTKVVNALALAQQDLPKIRRVLCLGSAARERFLDSDYFAETVTASPEGFFVGRRQAQVPFLEVMSGSMEYNSPETAARLSINGVPITAVSIKGDEVMKHTERMRGRGIKDKKVLLNKKGLNPSQLHNWVGEENRLKLEEIIRDFLVK